MLKKIFFILLILNQFEALSQAKAVDSLSNKPVSFVEVYTKAGKFLGITDKNGFFTNSLKNKIKNSSDKVVNLYNFSYKEKIISKESIYDNLVIKLQKIPKNQIDATDLDEVVINAKKPKYKKYKIYFRSTQFNNLIPQYFMDGIANYWISSKGKIRIEIIENRSISNPNIPELDEKGLTNLSFNITGVPDISDFHVANNLENLHNNFEINLELISKENEKTMKFLGNTSVFKNHIVDAKHNPESKNLEYFREFRNYFLTPKKSNKKQNIKFISEVFVLENSFEEKKSKSNLNIYQFIPSSNFKNKFWEIENHHLYPLPKSVNNFISKEGFL